MTKPKPDPQPKHEDPFLTPVRRFVSANDAPRPETVARASVFDNGSLPIDPLNPPTEMGVPIPRPLRKPGQFDAMFDDLPVGGSKSFELDRAKALKTAVYERRDRRPEQRYTIRTLENEVRIWRLEDEPRKPAQQPGE